MRRRDFLGAASAFSLQLSPPGELCVERPPGGKSHAGKILAAIQPHADDILLFAAGLVLKPVAEGYKGYLVRTTNDDMRDPGGIGEGVLANESENREVARAFGLGQVFDLNYGNHRMDGISKPELCCRLIFLFPCCVWTPSSRSIRGVLTKRIPTITSPPNASKRPAGWRTRRRITRSASRRA
ncbi:MAG: hypothetical protein RMI94_15690 [Bryobacterales bacterium]|nr:PIG-L family deacetylase [Bryobacteraceae bacterium]MDW8131991.1 hypothetical protein [Bryobacterales bacterium]